MQEKIVLDLPWGEGDCKARHKLGEQCESGEEIGAASMRSNLGASLECALAFTRRSVMLCARMCQRRCGTLRAEPARPDSTEGRV